MELSNPWKVQWTALTIVSILTENSIGLKVQIYIFFPMITPDRRQSKTLLIIDECGSKIARNSVFDYHLSPIWRQMAIENYVSSDVWSIPVVLTFSIAAYPVWWYDSKRRQCFTLSISRQDETYLLKRSYSMSTYVAQNQWPVMKFDAA